MSSYMKNILALEMLCAMGPRGCPNGFGSMCSETEILARVGDILHVKQMSHAIALRIGVFYAF